MERQKQWLGGLCVILGAVIFGSMPLSANFLYAQDVTPMMLVFLRNTLSLPVLALLGWRQGGLRLSRGALIEIGLSGLFGCFLTPVLLFSSIAILTPAWPQYFILLIRSL